VTEAPRPSLAGLRRGDALPPFTLHISSADVAAYLEATGERCALWSTLVPPLALGAFALAGLMERVELPAGILHTGQEHEFRRPLAHDEPVEVGVEVGARSERGGAVVLALDGVWRAGGEEVGTSRTTVLVPPPGEARG